MGKFTEEEIKFLEENVEVMDCGTGITVQGDIKRIMGNVGGDIWGNVNGKISGTIGGGFWFNFWKLVKGLIQ